MSVWSEILNFNPPPDTAPRTLDRARALLFMRGILGAHRFYLRRRTSGAIMAALAISILVSFPLRIVFGPGASPLVTDLLVALPFVQFGLVLGWQLFDWLNLTRMVERANCATGAGL